MGHVTLTRGAFVNWVGRMRRSAPVARDSGGADRDRAAADATIRPVLRMHDWSRGAPLSRQRSHLSGRMPPWTQSRRMRSATFASTRRSTWSSWASAWQVRRRSWQRGRLVWTCWPWNMRHGAGWNVGQLRRTHLPGRRVRLSRRPAATRTRPTTWRRSSGPPSVLASTTTASTPTARVRRTISTGWSRSACPSGRHSATSRTVNQPMIRVCSSAAVRTAIPSTKLPSRCRAGTSRCASIPPAASSWSALAPPWERVPLA
jgi:hypothetical protein